MIRLCQNVQLSGTLTIKGFTNIGALFGYLLISKEVSLKETLVMSHATQGIDLTQATKPSD